MAWIQVDDGIREHDKIYNLADALGITNAHAVGLMVCFWTWAATAAPDGNVTNFPPRAIAKAAGWEKGGAKGAQKFYNELLSIRLLEQRENKVLIRNWEQRATLLLDYIEQQRENTRRRVQKCRERKKKKQGVTVTPEQDNSVTSCNGDGNVTETLCNGITPPNLKVPNQNKLSKRNTPSGSTVESADSVTGNPDDGAGTDFGTVCQAFEDKVKMMATPKDGEILSELFKAYPLKRILSAIDETARCKGRSASYVRSVLQNEDREPKAQPSASGPDLTDPNRYKNFGK